MGNRLAGKVIVVTGATRGIGKGVALGCAAQGAKVAISGRNASDGGEVANEIEDRYGTEAIFVQGDLSSEAACEQLIKETTARFGKLDGLVNNAGIFPRGTLLETTEDMFQSVMDVNFKGAFFCSKYAIHAMLRNGGGSIVHMGSTHGYSGGVNLAAYACSKGALRTLNRHISSNYSAALIRSNWVTVGWVASEGEIELQGNNGVGVEVMRRIAFRAIPTGRLQTNEDMSAGVVYLLSDEASQVTGTELNITGGLVIS